MALKDKRIATNEVKDAEGSEPLVMRLLIAGV